MLRVYIIDDDDKQRGKLTDIVNNIITDDELRMKVEISTTSIREFIHKLQDNHQKGIYLLDVDLGGDIHGIELAELIKKYDLNPSIIFITTHGELCNLTFEYKVQCLSFLQKGNYNDIYDNLRECFFRIVNNQKLNMNRYLKLKGKEREIELIKDDICYIEYLKGLKKILVHCENRQVEVNLNIKELSGQLGDTFMMINKKLYVNLRNIEKVDFDEKTLIMKNGEGCYVGSRMIKKVKKTINY